MATASVPNTFVVNTPADPDEVNANFDALVDFVNDNTVHKDGSKAMSGDLDLGGNQLVNLGAPSASTDGANKSYVDTSVATKEVKLTRTAFSTTGAALNTVTWTTETVDPDGFITVPSTTLTVPAGLGGLWLVQVTLVIGGSWGTLGSDEATVTAGGVAYKVTPGKTVSGASRTDHPILMRLAQSDTIVLTIFTTNSVTLTPTLHMVRVGL